MAHEVVCDVSSSVVSATAPRLHASGRRRPVSAHSVAGARSWTLEDVRALGLTCDVPTAGAILGISRSLAYRMVAEDTFPVRTLRLSRTVRVSIPELLTYLGVPFQSPVAPGPAP
jgi:hypothetical protein